MIYLFIYFLKVYSSVNRTGPPQGLSQLQECEIRDDLFIYLFIYCRFIAPSTAQDHLRAFHKFKNVKSKMIYLFIYLLQDHSPVNRTGPPQALSQVQEIEIRDDLFIYWFISWRLIQDHLRAFDKFKSHTCIYLVIHLLKVYSPVNRTGSPQGFFTSTNLKQDEHKAKHAHYNYKYTRKTYLST